MRLEIRRRSVKVTEQLRTYLKERLRLALGRFARHIGLVRVYLRDVNGPRAAWRRSAGWWWNFPDAAASSRRGIRQ